MSTGPKLAICKERTNKGQTVGMGQTGCSSLNMVVRLLSINRTHSIRKGNRSVSIELDFIFCDLGTVRLFLKVHVTRRKISYEVGPYLRTLYNVCFAF